MTTTPQKKLGDLSPAQRNELIRIAGLDGTGSGYIKRKKTADALAAAGLVIVGDWSVLLGASVCVTPTGVEYVATLVADAEGGGTDGNRGRN